MHLDSIKYLGFVVLSDALIVVGTFSLLLADAEKLSVLLGSQESDDGVGANSEVVGGETRPEAQCAFFGHGDSEAVNDTGVGQLAIRASLLLLHLGLNVIEGKGADGSSHGGDHGATELDFQGRGVWAHHGCG